MKTELDFRIEKKLLLL